MTPWRFPLRVIALAVPMIGLTPALAERGKPSYFRYYELNRDSSYRLMSDFELNSKGEVSWKTTRRGGHCHPAAGWFHEKLSKEKAHSLLDMALSAAHSQADSQPKITPQKESNDSEKIEESGNFLEVIVPGKDHFLSIQKSTPATEVFFQNLALAQGSLSPRSALELKIIESDHKHLRIRFQHLGDHPVRIPLPKDLNEVLRIETQGGHHLRFRSLENFRNNSVLVGQQSSHIDLTLELASPLSDNSYPIRLRFNSQSQQHHLREFTHVDPADTYIKPMDLCVSLARAQIFGKQE